MASSIRILNFDDSVTAQKSLINKYAPEITDLRDIGPDVRYWARKNAVDRLVKQVPHSETGDITFLGSGDFHHISTLLISRIKEPCSVIVFDGHPDWDIMPQPLCCGSWVNSAAKLGNVRKIILLGVSSDDPAAFERNKVDMYPYSRKPSWILTSKIPFLKQIRWKEMKGKDAKAFFAEVLRSLPVKRVYLSIDKDCLKKEYAVTNWEEGKLGLDELLIMIKLIKEKMDIIGADIGGDYSPVLLNGIFKKIVSGLDHPKDVKKAIPSLGAITAVNENANIKILEVLAR